jgi:hypothetical protein
LDKKLNDLLKRKQDASSYGNLFTPSYATELIVPYLHGTIWECAAGLGHMSEVFRKNGLEVIETDISSGENFLELNLPQKNIDFIVTNPPYKLKDKFLERCYMLDIPFALLLPLTALGAAKRVSMYMEHGLEVLIPDKRINFIYPNAKDTAWFHSAWFCHNVLPEKLMFVKIERG